MQNPYPLPDCPGGLESSFWVSLIKHFDFAIRIYQEEWQIAKGMFYSVNFVPLSFNNKKSRKQDMSLVFYHFSYKGKGVGRHINVYSKNNSNDKISYYSLMLRLQRRTVFPSTLFGQMDTYVENIDKKILQSHSSKVSVSIFSCQSSSIPTCGTH